MENAPWSSLFARRIAETVGYGPPGASPGTSAIPSVPEAEKIVEEVTEAFRYLAPEKIQLALDFAEFLRTSKAEGHDVTSPVRQSWEAEKLAEVRDLALFLRSRYGAEQPADEKDYWTEEDRQDAQAEARRRLEEQDACSWEDACDAGAG